MTRPPFDRTSVIEGRDAGERRAPSVFDHEDLDWGDALDAVGRRQAATERRRRRRRRYAVLAVLAALMLPLVLGVGWFYFQLNPRGGPGATFTFVVEEDWGTGEVAAALSDAGVIGSTTAFRIWASIAGAGPYAPGEYTMQENLGVRRAVNVLKVGPPTVGQADLTLLLPPGLTLAQIADRVGQLPGRSSETFLQVVTSGVIRSKYMPEHVQSVEGFLFPDTYRIGVSEDEGSIAQKLVARFDEVADSVGLSSSAASNGLTPFETVVAASLIQTEAKLAEDAPLISAVIRNRLRDRMPLQIDSTLCYAKGGCPPVPTNADKQIDSPFNTYRFSGLPPTPIASVTAANLRAALSPADVTYKYYVLKDADGGHKFADTLEEHDANVREARAKGLL